MSSKTGETSGEETLGSTERDPREGPDAAEVGAKVDRYVILERVGAGGMGEVYAAYDPELDRRVAIKLVKPGLATPDDKARSRLIREAQSLAQLSHPNVVSVFDVGSHGDAVFVAMEHIDGTTLGDWWTDQPRSWREVAAAMLAAGHGLQAAHGVGLVHRDFKPSNVMIDARGRVVVLDFGLARTAADRSGSARPQRPVEVPDLLACSEQITALTETGTLLGTPGYMAPEQLTGGEVDTRTDQFSFCIVLFKGLYGMKPFVADNPAELSIAVVKGDVRPRPPRTKVPLRIDALLRRGLQPHPARRFGSMDELLAELEGALGRRRRWWGAAAAFGTAAVAVAGFGAMRPERPCQSFDRLLRDVWSDVERNAVRESFAQTEVPFAADAAGRTIDVLDAYAETWTRGRTNACAATRIRGDQSERAMDLRVACLDHGRDALKALVGVLSRADREIVRHAVDGASTLPSLSRCADVEALLSGVKPPGDDATRDEVSRVRTELVRSEALASTGKYAEALAIVERLAIEIGDMGYEPVRAEIGVSRGILSERVGRVDAGIEYLDQALWLAIGSGHGVAEARALVALIGILGAHRPGGGEALRRGRHAQAVLERIGNPPHMQALMFTHLGLAHSRRREFDEASAAYERAIAIEGDEPALATSRLLALGNLAMTRAAQGRYDEAERIGREALTMAEERLGPRHPTVAGLLTNLGANALDRGENDGALELLERAQSLYRDALGEDNLGVAQTLSNLAIAYDAKGDHAAALAAKQRSLAIKEAILAADDPSLALALNNVADALLVQGRPDEALPLAERARGIWDGSPGEMYALGLLADAHHQLGRMDHAASAIERCLELAQSHQAADLNLASFLFTAARIRWDAGGRAEARKLASRSRSLFAGLAHGTDVERIDAWLREHP